MARRIVSKSLSLIIPLTADRRRWCSPISLWVFSSSERSMRSVSPRSFSFNTAPHGTMAVTSSSPTMTRRSTTAPPPDKDAVLFPFDILLYIIGSFLVVYGGDYPPKAVPPGGHAPPFFLTHAPSPSPLHQSLLAVAGIGVGTDLHGADKPVQI